ncbi:MAG: hypothetical protein IM534_07385 [Chitinophagaceae bacterium]|nr:hypothetical protein [Chitinophagaceae bacterium]MCA6472229.1 hypothetical protein [Chitinophagaceae bacterium]MCA6487667.1 hypothetical protein [Chitinophagaceae bacterium]
MNDISMHTHAKNEVNETSFPASTSVHQENSTSHAKPAQNRTRFGIADLWKIQRNQRSAMAQRRNIL